MTSNEFDRIVADVMAHLPVGLTPYLNNLVVDVQEWPDVRDVDNDEVVYGLFVPSQFDSDGGLGGVDDFDQPPHRIIIYQKPLEQDFPDRDELIMETRKTVVHELAHHFGWTDRDLERFDEDPNPFG